MDAYDWDKTVFKRDTTSAFFAYCVRRFPGTWRCLPVSMLVGIRHLQRKPPVPAHKQRFYRFYAHVPNLPQVIKDFWAENEALIGSPAMPTNPQPGDLIISASPEFLLKDMCEKRGFVLIASKIDPKTGDMLAPDCFDYEKVRRFRALYGEDATVDNWYSDSVTDAPMAAIAKHAWLVTTKEILPWPEGAKAPGL